jgi:hypothetical protein
MEVKISASISVNKYIEIKRKLARRGKLLNTLYPKLFNCTV